MRGRSAALFVSLAMAVAACTGGEVRPPQGSPPSSPSGSPTPSIRGALDFGAAEDVATGLEVPWDLAFVDTGTILVTERPGRVRVVRDGRVQQEPVATVAVQARGEGGLLGIALHPRFPDEPFAYLYYTHAGGNRISRFRVADDLMFSAEQVLLDRIPSAAFHNGGSIAFGPDGMLYATTGDGGEPRLAADRASLAGKILRIAPDGSAPGDNPFANAVWSYGHRNPQGMGWAADGAMYVAEHGPSGGEGACCHDEINRIEAGGFYGWPYRAGRADRPVSGDPPADPIDPIADSGGSETWAPSGLAVDERDGRAVLYVAALRGTRVLSVSIDGRSVRTVMEGRGRIRAARIGPGECLFLTTSNTDGRGDPRDGDDRIMRICPSG